MSARRIAAGGLSWLITLSRMGQPWDARAAPPDPVELERRALAALQGPESCWAVRIHHEVTHQVGRRVKTSSEGQADVAFDRQVWWGAPTPLPAFSVGDFTCAIDPPHSFAEQAAGGLLGAATRPGGANTWVSTVEATAGGYLVRFDKDLFTRGGEVSRRLSVDVALDHDRSAVAIESHLAEVRGLGPGCSAEREVQAELGPEGLPRTETITTRSNCPFRRRQIWSQVATYQIVGACTPRTQPRMEPGREDAFEVCTERASEAGFAWGKGWRPAPDDATVRAEGASDEVGLPLSLTAELVSALSGSEGLRGCLRDGCCDRHEPHTLIVSFTIDASGAVTDVSLDEQHPDTVLRECVRRALEPLRFPEAPPGRVEYPLEIKPPAR